jgi:hypothetical protein
VRRRLTMALIVAAAGPPRQTRIRVDAPADRQVVQRDDRGRAVILVRGLWRQPAPTVLTFLVGGR